ncbi:hypothetical protein Bca4012_025803 [Brassica carinata]
MVVADEHDELSKATQREVESPRQPGNLRDPAPYTTSHEKRLKTKTRPTSDLETPSPEAKIICPSSGLDGKGAEPLRLTTHKITTSVPEPTRKHHTWR